MTKKVGPPRGGFSLDGAGRGRAQGRTAQASGRAFQEDVKVAAAWYASRELGALVEVPPETYGPAHARKFAGGRGSVDFVGLVVEEGAPTPLALDAKVTTGKATFTLSHDDPRERQRTALQVQFLRAYKRMGGIAGYLCLDREVLQGRGALFWLDADALAGLATPAALIGADSPPAPAVVIRFATRGGGFDTAHPWIPLPTIGEVASGAAPSVPWRALVLAARAGGRPVSTRTPGPASGSR